MNEETTRAMHAKAIAMESSRAKLEMLEYVARRAESEADYAQSSLTRMHLFNEAIRSGAHERMIETYTWLRARAKTHPDAVDADWLLRAGPFVVDSLDPFPEIPLAQIYALYAEQEEMFRERGVGMRDLHRSRTFTELAMGRLDRARAAAKEWLGTPVDPNFTACLACDHNSQVSLHAKLGDDAKALDAAAPILDGRVKCHTVPRTTYGELLLPLVRLGRWAEAREHHERGYAAMRRATGWMRDVAEHVVFAVLSGQMLRARNMIERYVPLTVGHQGKLDPLIFYEAVLLFLAKAAAGGQRTVTLRLPDAHALADRGPTHPVVALQDWFETTARSFAGQLDRRNENDHYTRRIDGVAELLALAPH